METKVKRTERGWAGHFIGGSECLYHRNTLLEFCEQKVVVSTVGRYSPFGKHHLGEFEMIGHNRYFETMAFIAKDDEYHDIDVQKQVEFNSNWCLPKSDMELEADKMHEDVCAEISEYMINNNIKIED